MIGRTNIGRHSFTIGRCPVTPEVTEVIAVDAFRRRGDDFSVGGTEIGEKQSRQSNSKYNFMQYVFFEKGNGVWDKAPEPGELSRIFVSKVALQSLRLTAQYNIK